MKLSRIALLAASLLAGASELSAQKMFVRKPAQYLGYGYQNSYWTTYTSMWDARFGAANIVSGNSIGSLAGYTSLLLDPSQSGSSAYNLTAGEIAEIGTFLAGGGRIYGFGENDNWTSWNQSLLGLFGASFGGLGGDYGTPSVANLLTSGVTSISTPAPGAISNFNGGVSLFSNNIAGLFNNNSVVVLDINICDDTYINNNDNRRFCQNIVDFTAGDPVIPGEPTVAPEPASVAMVGFGLLVAGGVARRRRNKA
ncbi:MAG: PEP-CTERM sorting domain-containing protein [Gemmatimonas sp.]